MVMRKLGGTLTFLGLHDGLMLDGYQEVRFGADADLTLSPVQAAAQVWRIQDLQNLLTAAREFIVGTTAREHIAMNETAQTITVKTAAGTGYALASGKAARLNNDGTNITLVIEV